MSNDRLEPFNYHNIAFKRCADVVSLERLDRLWFFRHHWFVKIGWFGKNGVQGTNLLDQFISVLGFWNRSRILNFGPDRLFFWFSRALRGSHLGYWNGTILAILNLCVTVMLPIKFWLNLTYCSGGDVNWRISRWPPWRPSWILQWNNFSNSESLSLQCSP